MNKQELLSILKPFVRQQVNVDDSLQLDDVTTDLQRAKDNQIVFYRITGQQNSISLFQTRYLDAQNCLIITNDLPESLSEQVTNLIVVGDDNFYFAQKAILDKLYPMDMKFKFVGVTGTNGKTSVVNFASQIAHLLGKKSLSIGTLGVNVAGEHTYHETGATTPSYIQMRQIIHKYQEVVDVIFFEISSHGLQQQRIYDLKMDLAAWTNFTQDHLDYHKDMESYFNAKLQILSIYLKKGSNLLIPCDQDELKDKIVSKSDPTALDIIKKAKTLKQRGLFDVPKVFEVSFIRSNFELALELNESLWGSVSGVDIEKVKTPKGRFSLIDLGTKTVVIDYAHTPDALLNIVQAIKDSFPQYKLSLLFGCGGNRDRAKRKLMGEVASNMADKIYVTSDNPRFESPDEIISDIMTGISHPMVETIVDRKQAIQGALKVMTEDEILVIAGKGHEEYQEIDGVKHPFSDFKIVDSYTRSLGIV